MILDGVYYSALIQFCRVILSRMVEFYRRQSFLDEYCLICRVLPSLSVYRRPCVSYVNAPLLVQYALYTLFPRLLIFPLARVYQHTSVLITEVSLTSYGRRASLSPRAMAPSTSKIYSGLANPRWWIHFRGYKKYGTGEKM